jgi:tetratricopeptide (TPR) repeat protein
MPVPRPILIALASIISVLLATACRDAAQPSQGEAAPASQPEPGLEPEPAEAIAALERSLELESQGQLEAAAKAASDAIAAGGRRSAKLQAAKLAILAERYDEAEPLLAELIEADVNDADAHYNLGLVAHHRNAYNKARSSYLAALRANEDYANARYNLAILTWERNVVDEARHHVERFAEAWPKDPRTLELMAMINPSPPPTDAGAGAESKDGSAKPEAAKPEEP